MTCRTNCTGQDDTKIPHHCSDLNIRAINHQPKSIIKVIPGILLNVYSQTSHEKSIIKPVNTLQQAVSYRSIPIATESAQSVQHHRIPKHIPINKVRYWSG